MPARAGGEADLAHDRIEPFGISNAAAPNESRAPGGTLLALHRKPEDEA